LDFDTFAYLWLKKESPEEVIVNQINEGVDYIVLDYWVRFWQGSYKKQADELTAAVRQNARLVQVIAPDSMNRTEIYAVSTEKQNIFNGNFDQWVKSEQTSVPLGWQPVLQAGNSDSGDSAGILRDNINGKDCVRLTVSENGLPDGSRNATQVLIYQETEFPVNELELEIMPIFNSKPILDVARPTGIYFIDETGHALVFGFSDSVDSEEIFRSSDSNMVMILKPAPLSQWSKQTIDLAYYWAKIGWEQPEKINILILASSYYTQPGTHEFYIASIAVK
jgi:hypothetical protein